VSWEKAAAAAVKLASQSLRDLRVAQVTQLDMHIVDGKIAAYRAKVNLSFKYESSGDSDLAPKARRVGKAKAPEAEPEAPAPEQPGGERRSGKG
jgi:flavin-binding protein dodecin